MIVYLRLVIYRIRTPIDSHWCLQWGPFLSRSCSIFHFLGCLLNERANRTHFVPLAFSLSLCEYFLFILHWLQCVQPTLSLSSSIHFDLLVVLPLLTHSHLCAYLSSLCKCFPLFHFSFHLFEPRKHLRRGNWPSIVSPLFISSPSVYEQTENNKNSLHPCNKSVASWNLSTLIFLSPFGNKSMHIHLLLGFFNYSLWLLLLLLLVFSSFSSGDDTMMLLSVACVMLFSLARVYSTWLLLLLLCWYLARLHFYFLSVYLRLCWSLAKEKKNYDWSLEGKKKRKSTITGAELSGSYFACCLFVSVFYNYFIDHDRCKLSSISLDITKDEWWE